LPGWWSPWRSRRVLVGCMSSQSCLDSRLESVQCSHSLSFQEFAFCSEYFTALYAVFPSGLLTPCFCYLLCTLSSTFLLVLFLCSHKQISTCRYMCSACYMYTILLFVRKVQQYLVTIDHWLALVLGNRMMPPAVSISSGSYAWGLPVQPPLSRLWVPENVGVA
jgi:hypothetical protein